MYQGSRPAKINVKNTELTRTKVEKKRMTIQTLQWSEYRKVTEEDGNLEINLKKEMLTAGFRYSWKKREGKNLFRETSGLWTTCMFH